MVIGKLQLDRPETGGGRGAENRSINGRSVKR